jgi:anaerobic selenocysteine-containing dehydrogenase
VRQGTRATGTPRASGPLLRSRKRVGSEFTDIDVEQAMDEIAGQLAQIRDRHGPRAIASYLGTFITANHVTAPLIDSFMRELGSPMAFTPIPIDKPGKEISRALHGTWQAPAQGFDRPDVCLLIGANPFVSYTGFPFGHPQRWLREQTDRGMRLIVVAPRVTPVARRASCTCSQDRGMTRRSSPRSSGSYSPKISSTRRS